MEEYESILDNLAITDSNFEIFLESPVHFHKAIEYLIKMNQIARAAIICRVHGDYNMAASIYERAGDFKSAGKEYRNARN